MRNSNYGKSVEVLEALLQAERAKMSERHALCVERGDDDEAFLGLSAWAEQLRIRQLETEVSLAKNGWKAPFPALLNEAGQTIKATLRQGPYGAFWAIQEGPFQGKAVGFGKAKPLAKYGLVEGQAMRPARAEIVGSGSGLSGAASCRVEVVEVLPCRCGSCWSCAPSL
jgi:hypothetical protein